MKNQMKYILRKMEDTVVSEMGFYSIRKLEGYIRFLKRIKETGNMLRIQILNRIK